MRRLANLNRIVNVSDLNLEGMDNQEDTPFTVETAMVLTAYTQGPSAPVEGTRTEDGEGILDKLNAKAEAEETVTNQAGISQ